MHEIVTLQFGQQANYVGTHYWNTQESYFTYQEESPVDHDISFRAGIGVDGGDTFAPRALIYDLKGAFGTLRRENALYSLQQSENPAQNGPWSDHAIPLRLPPIEPSAYQQALDQGTSPPPLSTQTVRFWSDYNHLFYHPRSIVQLNEYELNSSLMPFERWQSGEDLFASLDREHDLLDRDLRPWLEECDQLQALQIMTGVDNAWGGFAARYLERISDELGKGCRWVFGMVSGPSSSRERQRLSMVNTAQSVLSFDSSASVHVPLSSTPPMMPTSVSLDTLSPWHTSAVAALGMESITLPTRLVAADNRKVTFNQLETTLNDNGCRSLAALGFWLETPTEHNGPPKVNGHSDSRVNNGLEHREGSADEAGANFELFPEMVRRESSAGRSQPVRSTKTFTKLESLRGDHWKSTTETGSVDQASDDRSHYGIRTSSHFTQLLFPLLSSYPRIFKSNGHPTEVAVKTQLRTSTAVSRNTRALESAVRGLVSIDEREMLSDGLIKISEDYDDGWGDDDDGEYDDD